MDENEVVTIEESPAPSASPSAAPSPSPSPTADLAALSERVERIDKTLAHPLLSTPLEDYTVSEGLLLGLLIAVIVAGVVTLLRRAFSWL